MDRVKNLRFFKSKKKETYSFNTGSFKANTLLTMKNSARTYTNVDGAFVSSISVVWSDIGWISSIPKSRSSCAWIIELWSFFDRRYRGTIHLGKAPWFETERPARCIHSAVSSRAMCNDIAFTDRRGHCGITITCHKLFTNTRCPSRRHTRTRGREKRRGSAGGWEPRAAMHGERFWIVGAR